MGKLFKDLSYMDGKLYCEKETRSMKRKYVTIQQLGKVKGQVIPLIVNGKQRYMEIPDEPYEQIMREIKAQNKLQNQTSANQRFVQDIKVNVNKAGRITNNKNKDEEYYR